MTRIDDITERHGVTYRQLDYWTTRGYILADACNPGSGVQRDWPESELAIAEMIGALSRAGLDVPTAARVARAHATTGEHLIPIAAGVSVWLEPSLEDVARMIGGVDA